MTTKIGLGFNGAAYSVTRTPRGVVIEGGPVPVDDLSALAKAWGERGYTIMDQGIAQALGAFMVITDEEGSKAWREEIEAGLAHSVDAELAWLKGTDTGVSSRTIFSVLSSRYGAGALGSSSPDFPYDPSDFGRCHRLLERLPAWRARMGEVAAKHPRWAPFVERWEEMTATYVEEQPTGYGPCPRLYEALQQCCAEWDRRRAAGPPSTGGAPQGGK